MENKKHQIEKSSKNKKYFKNKWTAEEDFKLRDLIF